MERVSKPIFIFLLLSVSISASVFMIIESGSFFQGLYKTGSHISFMGYWAAFLNEVFMGVMAAVWIPGKKGKLGENIHPINVMFKLLLVFLFITTVCGSSLKTVSPLYDIVQKQANQRKVIEILRSQVNDNDKSLDAFVSQNQRVNAALSVRNQIKIKEELKQMLNMQKSDLGLWLEISIVIFIRFGVQLANLSCVWLAGWLYRQPTKIKQNKPNQRQQDLGNKRISRVGELANYPVKTPSRILFNAEIPSNNTTSQRSRQKSVSQKNRPIFSNNSRNSKPEKKPEVNISAAPKMSIEQEKEQDKIRHMRVEIARLLRSRNEGISLSDIGKAIGEKEANLREIVHPKLKSCSSTIPALESILAKIENLYNEEQTRLS